MGATETIGHGHIDTSSYDGRTKTIGHGHIDTRSYDGRCITWIVCLIFFFSSASCLWNVPLVTDFSFLFLVREAIFAWASPRVTIVSLLQKNRNEWTSSDICRTNSWQWPLLQNSSQLLNNFISHTGNFRRRDSVSILPSARRQTSLMCPQVFGQFTLSHGVVIADVAVMRSRTNRALPRHSHTPVHNYSGFKCYLDF